MASSRKRTLDTDAPKVTTYEVLITRRSDSKTWTFSDTDFYRVKTAIIRIFHLIDIDLGLYVCKCVPFSHEIVIGEFVFQLTLTLT